MVRGLSRVPPYNGMAATGQQHLSSHPVAVVRTPYPLPLHAFSPHPDQRPPRQRLASRRTTSTAGPARSLIFTSTIWSMAHIKVANSIGLAGQHFVHGRAAI